MKKKNIELIAPLVPFLLITLAAIVGMTSEINLLTSWGRKPVKVELMLENHTLLTDQGER